MASMALAQLYLPCCMHDYLRTDGLGGSPKEVKQKQQQQKSKGEPWKCIKGFSNVIKQRLKDNRFFKHTKN